MALGTYLVRRSGIGWHRHVQGRLLVIGECRHVHAPNQVFYKILIEGKTYTVNLTQKNILPYNFRVYGYNSSEIMKPLIQKFQNLCNYQGHVEGFPNSAVTISTCFGLRGLIQFEKVSYGIEPIETSAGFEHIIHPVKNKNASYSLYTKMENERTQPSHKIPRGVELQLYNTAPYNRYIEIHVVVEKKMYDHMGANTAAVTQKVFQVIGLVSAMLTSLNITLILSSLELWISDNKISINGEADELLYRFLNWKNTYLVLRPHDVAILLVYREKSNYVGATLKGIMCDIKNSGGVLLYSRAISLEALAVIVTQLLSLSMGIRFDDSKCQCSGAACIMSPKAIYFSGVKPFSSCSMEDFILFISKPKSQCLQNQPHLDPSYKRNVDTCKAPFGCPSTSQMDENNDKIPALMLEDGRQVIEDVGKFSGLS
ncbi:disintegrin and metalloproteinase domain-containing protein 2-like [Echinops telfairi]|uniref:Disintegrin and metalloproteinase domain-containing protein 2-like n=1 Tax=Echinops telfairi TaxID=9371 RepID=A0ABM1VIV7_ECHTE|nr:disintegrin and metalloproteinase domain-containing protein 2-like [Echinops telfairi]